MKLSTLERGICGAILASLAGCGGSGTTSSTPASTTSAAASSAPAAVQSANVPLIISDASTEDWATIGVKVLSIALQPQGGGSAVTVYTAPASPPMINLVQLDQIGEILGNVTVPVGTYSSAIVTVSANPSDILLTVANDPQAGFPAAAGSTIPSAQIEVQKARGTAPNLSVPIEVAFNAPLTVSSSQSGALDLEFDLSHPAFLIAHEPAGSADTIWSVDFNGPLRHQPVKDITRLVLRHTYGLTSSVAADNSSITITKEMPSLPLQSPETAVATSQTLQILADATNGTLFYDVDAKTRATIENFSSVSGTLSGKYVRVAARYQQDGTLVATRIWASTSFNDVWLSPEGHVLHVDTATNVVTVATESGGAARLQVDANTQFFVRDPANSAADATPVAMGTAFLAAHDLVRGFKIHASVVDPLATPWVAQSIEIETAAFDGRISAADTTGFTYTRKFFTAADDYIVTLPYIGGSLANGLDGDGDAVNGFKWWDFAYPTLTTTGSGAVPAFVAATNGGVDFGGTAGSVTAWGFSSAAWNSRVTPNSWAVALTILEPTPLPLATVVSGFDGSSFTMTVPGAANAATVDLSTVSGSATLVYLVDRTGRIVSVSPIDASTGAGQMSLTGDLVSGATVKVFAVPQANGTLKAYAVTLFTGTKPAS